MSVTRHIVFLMGALLCLSTVRAQDKTRVEKEKTPQVATKHKVLLIPFEPRLYFGEIDFAINMETRMTAKQIKHSFRDGLNDELAKALKTAKFAVTDMMEDTLKYKKDLHSLYGQLSYKYLKVPDPLNYQAPKEEKAQKAIENGQLNVETNSDKRFMDARISSPALMKQLQAKYRCDLFVFVNQLDILAGGSNEPAQPYKTASTQRKIKVHYTVFNTMGHEIHSGLLEEEFSSELNQPRKIIEKHFSKLGKELSTRISRALGETGK